MKRFGMLIVFCLVSSSIWAADEFKADISPDDLVAKMKKAVDPDDKGKNLKTQSTKILMSMPLQGITVKVESKHKEPRKSLDITSMPNGMTVTSVLNGKDAWEVSPMAGVRKLTGKELGFKLLNADMESYSKDLKEIFSDIKIVGVEKVAGKDCYKVILTPKKEYQCSPLTQYVDKKSFLVLKMVVKAVTQMGDIPATYLMEDYQKKNGFLVPMKLTGDMMGTKMIVTVKELKFNEPMDDKLFEEPKAPAAPKKPNVPSVPKTK